MRQILFTLLLLGLVGCAVAPAITPAPPTKMPTRTPTFTPTPTATFTPSATPTLPPYPVVFSIDPPSGPIAGGTEITIIGVNFSEATLQLDGEALIPIEQSGTAIRFEAPTHDSGIVSIKIQTSLGAGYGEFLYLPPSLDEIEAGEITTFAGVGLFYGEGRPAIQAIVAPVDIALDSLGNLYITEPDNSRILRIRSDGRIETFAGIGTEGFSQDGIPATEAALWQARGIALDDQGNLYIAESWAHRLRRVDAATGIISTVAGNGNPGFSGDGGPAVFAHLNFPNHVAIGGDGSIYVLDSGNHRVRRIAPDGTITTIAGNGMPGYSGDEGPATEAQFHISFVDNGGIAVDPQGNVFLADTDNNVVRKIDMQTGIISTIAQVDGVRAVTFDQQGYIYFASNSVLAPRIIKMDPQGKIIRSWGQGERGFSEDGTPAETAHLGAIDRIRVDQNGNILYTDFTALRVRRINITSGLLETIAGIGPGVIGQDGPAMFAVIDTTNSDLAFLPNGNLLITDTLNQHIWQVDENGIISAYAFSGLFGLLEKYDIPASEAHVYSPAAIELDKEGNIFIANTHVVSKIDQDGIVRHVAGAEGEWSFSGDGGQANVAALNRPWDVAVDDNGNLYIADSNNNRIRRVDLSTGTITTVAGSGEVNDFEGYGQGSFCGDNGLAVEACLNTPHGVAVDREGNLYIADSFNHRIRKVDREGIITTFADFRPDGWPTKLVFDAEGNLYTAVGTRVYRISPSGQITIIAGMGEAGFSGDGGLATEALILVQGQATGIAIDEQGNLFFTDGFNNRVRVIKGAAPAGPANW